jgi:uroporphyrinogen-III synthase
VDGSGSGTFGSVPLVGCVVAVTADRKRDELADLLRRRGARVVVAPTLRTLPVGSDEELRTATERCMLRPPEFLVVTTGVGWRGWMTAADGWGRGEQLRKVLAHATLVTRGAKATSAVRASGLTEAYTPESESSREVLAWLLSHELSGAVVAVQQVGAFDVEFVESLRVAGAEVLELPVYQWARAEDSMAVRRLIDGVTRREVHAVAFTSAPGAAALLDAASELGRHGELVSAFGAPSPAGGYGGRVTAPAGRPPVLAACIGPLCAGPLRVAGVPAVWPDRGRLGSLVQVVVDELAARLRRTVDLPYGRLVVQGNAVVVTDLAGVVRSPDGTRAVEPLVLPPLPAAVLHELVRRPGWVVSRTDLLRRVWGGRGGAGPTPGEHTVEAAVARLRDALGPHAKLVRTVTKRGYRLAVDP